MARHTQTQTGGWGVAIATLIAIIVTITANTWTNLSPPNDLNVGEIANTVLAGVLITPANYAFAIWGLIYLGVVAYGIYQLFPAQRQDPVIRRASLGLIVASLAQTAWIYLFPLQLFWLSVVAMAVILLALAVAYAQLNPGRSRAGRRRRWLAQIPFSIYLGWISVASLVNVASALYASGFEDLGLGAVPWTVIVLLIGAGLGAIAIWRHQDLAFVLVLVWAFTAVAVRHSDVLAIWLTAVLCSLGLIVGWVGRRQLKA